MMVHHIKITIPPGTEPEARAFYCGVLGLEEYPKPPELRERGGLWLQADNLLVFLGVEDNPFRATTKAHIGYGVTNLETWRQRCATAGIDVRQVLPVAGHERFEISDPFGNRIEIQLVAAG